MTSIQEKELTHKPLKEEIFDALHRHIIAGKYGPGDWLRQEDIASQMGVSMTPVREALDLLVASGLQNVCLIAACACAKCPPRMS